MAVEFQLPADAPLDANRPWSLVETGAPSVRCTAQVDVAWNPDGTPDPRRQRVLAVVPPRAGETDSDGTRRFQLRQSESDDATTESGGFRFLEEPPDRLHLQEGERNVLTYNGGLVTRWSVPPEDRRRTRGCYVHPLWGLQGEVITDDFPKDHYHHHGVFWGWPYLRCGGAVYDTWTATNAQQRRVRWLHRSAGPVAAVLGVENGWFDGERLLATERVWLTSYAAGPDSRSVDLTLVVAATESPVTLQGREKKSYGGLTVRYDVWPRKDAIVRTPEHMTRQAGNRLASSEDLVNTPLPWADLAARFPGSEQRSGAAVFVSPRHPDYPPSWLTRTYGALCVGWPGIKPYTIQQGESVALDYRLWIHRTEVESADIAQQYETYRRMVEQHASGS